MAAVTLGALPLAQATTLGFNNDPASPGFHRGAANTGYAVWDTFPAFTYSADAPDAGSGITNPTLGQSGALAAGMGGGLYNVFPTTQPGAGQPGDVLFGGGSNVAFLAAGNVAFTIRGVVLQIKRPGSTATLADANGFAPTLSINGAAPIAADSFATVSGNGDTSSTAGAYSVTSWYWNTSLAALPGAASSAFSLDISHAGSQRGIDGIVVDVGNAAAVPEPAALAWLLGGGVVLFLQLSARARGRGWA